eukprot:COSAG06_NODE_2352_length_7023_cov_2.994368_5_plen_265_part_00
MAFRAVPTRHVMGRVDTAIRWLARRRHSTTSEATAAATGDAAGAAARTRHRPLVGTTQGAAAGAEIGERADIIGLRLAHENTYLSWSRNGIIATVAALGIHTATLLEHPTDPPTGRASSSTWPLHVTPPAAAMLGVAATFFSFGTLQYLAQLVVLAPVLQLTTLRRAWMAAHALGAAGFWTLGIAAFVTHDPTVLAAPVSSASVTTAKLSSAAPPVSSTTAPVAEDSSRADSGREAGGGGFPATALAISAVGLLALASGRGRSN